MIKYEYEWFDYHFFIVNDTEFKKIFFLLKKCLNNETKVIKNQIMNFKFKLSFIKYLIFTKDLQRAEEKLII